MADLLANKLTATDFNVDRFVKEISQSSVGGLELQQHKQKIQQLSEDTNTQLKKNVYMNYMQFIETAKEISALESEMYQLSHLITEQKSLLSSLLEISLSEKNDPANSSPEIFEMSADEIQERKENLSRKKLTALLEKVEGCSHILEVESRYLLFDGDLLELNQDDYSALQRVHAYLLNDSLMVASWLSDRRGPVRYKFQQLYSLDQVLPVNIKDRGVTKNSFKILIFPDTRVFQTPNAKNKQEWLDEIERAKQNKMAADLKAAEAAQEQLRLKHGSLSKEDSIESNTEYDDDSTNPFFTTSPLPPMVGPPLWLQELPEELDQAIAQRNFEDAVELIEKGRKYYEGSKLAIDTEMRRNLELKVQGLVNVLMSELKVSPERSLQGGPRAARRATLLLVQLNRASQACDLFLKQRSALLKANVKRLRVEGKTVLYVKQLCSVFFHCLLETGYEFVKAFPVNRSCTSAFAVWANAEIRIFCSLFNRHVFTTQSSLSTVAECVRFAHQQCKQLSGIGLDLSFSLRTLLLKNVMKWIEDGRDKMIEAVKLRAQEDTWKPLTYETPQQFSAFLADINELGIPNIKTYVTSDRSIGLTNNQLQFARAFLTYLEDILQLMWDETAFLVNSSLTEVFSAQLRHCKSSMEDPLFANELPCLRRNCAFLLDVLLSHGEHRYAESTGHTHPTLPSLHGLRGALTKEEI